MAEIVLLVAAEHDVLQIYAVYEERHAGRGEIFSADVEHVFDLLGEFPMLAPIFNGPFRRIRLSRHPYAIFYEVAGNRVVVHAVRSDRESKDYIRRRLGL